MRKHNGMRPQDIAILLKIIALKRVNWQLKDISNALHISISEVSESLNRSQFAGLLDFYKKRVNRNALAEFLEHGIKYVFPQAPGALVRGVATAHSHPYLKKYFSSSQHYVWADRNGETLGQAIEPLYEGQLKAVKEDPDYYKMMALVDVIRVGKVREINVANKELKHIILNEPSG